MSTANQPSRYLQRQLDGVCVRGCERPSTDGDLCTECHVRAREWQRSSKARSRRNRKRSGRCFDCGRKAQLHSNGQPKRRCKRCAETQRESKRRGKQIAVVSSTRQVDPRRARIAAATRRDIEGAAAHARTRYHGRGKRGGLGNAGNDELDARLLKRELDQAIAELAHAHSPEVKAKPRIQARDILHAALARIHLVMRLLCQILERHKYAT